MVSHFIHSFFFFPLGVIFHFISFHLQLKKLFYYKFSFQSHSEYSNPYSTTTSPTYDSLQPYIFISFIYILLFGSVFKFFLFYFILFYYLPPPLFFSYSGIINCISCLFNNSNIYNWIIFITHLVIPKTFQLILCRQL